MGQSPKEISSFFSRHVMILEDVKLTLAVLKDQCLTSKAAASAMDISDGTQLRLKTLNGTNFLLNGCQFIIPRSAADKVRDFYGNFKQGGIKIRRSFQKL